MRETASATEIALGLLADNLRPIVRRALDANGGAGWQAIVGQMPDQQIQRNVNDWAPDELCKRIVKGWNVFRRQFSNLRSTAPDRYAEVFKNRINEIGYWRNQPAHVKPYTTQDEIHLLALVERVLADLRSSDAEKLRKLRRKIEKGLEPSWSKIAARAKWSDAIQLFPFPVTRSIGAPLQKFSHTQDVKLTFRPAHEPEAEGFPYVLVLVVDSKVATCLCPSRFAPECKISESDLTIPGANTPFPSLGFQGARGQHWIYVLLSKTELPREIYNLLNKPDELTILDEIARYLASVPVESLRLFQSEFEVI